MAQAIAVSDKTAPWVPWGIQGIENIVDKKRLSFFFNGVLVVVVILVVANSIWSWNQRGGFTFRSIQYRFHPHWNTHMGFSPWEHLHTEGHPHSFNFNVNPPTLNPICI